MRFLCRKLLCRWLRRLTLMNSDQGYLGQSSPPSSGHTHPRPDRRRGLKHFFLFPLLPGNLRAAQSRMPLPRTASSQALFSCIHCRTLHGIAVLKKGKSLLLRHREHIHQSQHSPSRPCPPSEAEALCTKSAGTTNAAHRR